MIATMSTVRKLVVEMVDARDLSPKDGHGTSSPYAILGYHGQGKRTKTVARDLNPTWNETLEFNIGKKSDVFEDVLEVDVYHDKTLGSTRRSNFLGRVKLNSTQFVRKGEEALIYYPLGKKNWYNWVQGELGLKIYYVDEVVPPPPPPPPPPAVDEAPEQAPTSTSPKEAEAGAGKSDLPVEAAPANVSVPPSPARSKSGERADAGKSDLPVEAAPINVSVPPSPARSKSGEKANENLSVPPSTARSKSGEKASENVSVPPSPARSKSGGNAVENAAPEAQNPQVSDYPPLEEQGGNAVEPELPIHDGPGEVNAFTATRSVAGVNISGFHGPKPIPRLSSVSSFASDLSDISQIERSTFDLVNKMHYLFVRVVKARSLPTSSNPVVKIGVSGYQVQSRPARKTQLFEWDQTFAFGRETPDSSSMLEISVWDVAGRNFLGGILFDVTEIPLRDPPDSPLAPQWYRLEGGGAHIGDLMLATWVGTQADESFADAWKSDTASNPSSKSKVYQSPKLWYLRLTVLEAQDIFSVIPSKETSFHVKALLGFQVLKTKPAPPRNGAPSWNEDLIFVAAEPFTDNHMIIFLEQRQPKESARLGVTSIPLASIERRVDDRQIVARWFNLEDPNEEKRIYKGRVQLRVCFDGGYHVMDEAAHLCSDYRPTARQLWKPPIGTIELGVVGCKNLLPMKTINGKGSTDAYAVAKYGNKWVRTRSISDSLDPKWNEQYTWRVYEPSTVLTIGVFDSWEVFEMDGPKESVRPDFRIGKVRIRVSTLQTRKVYRNSYPLILMTPGGLKKMGEIELAVRFIREAATLDFLHVYSQPLLPLMHHIKPLGEAQQEMLRTTTVKIVAAHLARSEPPLRREVVTYLLDADSHAFSMRKVKANWLRIVNVVAGLVDVAKWVNDMRAWKNPTATLLVHALLVMLVWYPDLIVPTLAFYVFAVGTLNYRFRSRRPVPHFDPKISLAESIDRDELDEEFDTMPTSRPNELVRPRYDKLRMIGSRAQKVLGDLATQGERMQSLVTWQDPRATGIFVALCFVVALILYLVPSKMVAMACGFYYLRHPIFRDRMPSPALNFFRRLPSLSDRIV